MKVTALLLGAALSSCQHTPCPTEVKPIKADFRDSFQKLNISQQRQLANYRDLALLSLKDPDALNRLVGQKVGQKVGHKVEHSGVQDFHFIEFKDSKITLFETSDRLVFVFDLKPHHPAHELLSHSELYNLKDLESLLSLKKSLRWLHGKIAAYFLEQHEKKSAGVKKNFVFFGVKQGGTLAHLAALALTQHQIRIDKIMTVNTAAPLLPDAVKRYNSTLLNQTLSLHSKSSIHHQKSLKSSAKILGQKIYFEPRGFEDIPPKVDETTNNKIIAGEHSKSPRSIFSKLGVH